MITMWGILLTNDGRECLDESLAGVPYLFSSKNMAKLFIGQRPGVVPVKVTLTWEKREEGGVE